ncbi:MAG: nitronate monooxygenase [Chloroflexi bacterium]|nr:nitronate monooxygenase [Chloroflexota bacterium]
MGIHTPICDLLGVEHPIGNAGMGGVAGPELCAAVAEAGGIGTVAIERLDAPRAIERIEAVRALTDRPFSANFIAWTLRGDSSPLDAVLATGVASVTLSFDDPTPYVQRIHDAGALVINQVQTVEDAQRAVYAGVDAIIAQGNDAGGHTGGVPLMPLLPQVVDAAGTIPVLAAGGIGDGRGLAAALMLGAQGALMGTRFIVSNEATSAWPNLPGQVLAASSSDTVWTTAIDIVQGGGTSRWPNGIGARSIRTPFLDRWASREAELVAALAADPTAAPENHDPTPAYAGPIAGMLKQHKGAAAIIATTIEEAARVIEAGHRLRTD